MTPRHYPLKYLDPAEWSKRPDGYDQQRGRAQLLRVKSAMGVKWMLYVDNEFRGQWPNFRKAKQGAAQLSATWSQQVQ